jgi:hypothetical protein
MHRRFRPFIFAAALTLASLAASAQTQEPACKNFHISDPQFPTYPPIARAAHVQGTFSFRVTVPASGVPKVTYLDGPNVGVWQFLLTGAQSFLVARRYSWDTAQPLPCTYTASVEYRILAGNLDAPNNFFRVTILDESHTLIEIKPTTPTATP